MIRKLNEEQKKRYEVELREAYRLLSDAACQMACIATMGGEAPASDKLRLVEPEKAADRATKAIGILSLVERWCQADEERAREEAASTVNIGGEVA